MATKHELNDVRLTPERLLKCVTQKDLRSYEAAVMLCPPYIRHGPARDKLLDLSVKQFDEYVRVVGASDVVMAGDLRFYAKKLREIWGLKE